ncbi:hypothetical protein ASF41_21670 [Methylobacterium sp. Leaf111]|uniref:hypothetical protein n=1 Tax=Methylobacterium sp. Leaf111 TaxID=1736257 RepID=UPI0006FDC575|nr:hypothetical protein [Methylobacterium sp. Leaf111]KQP67678.1 hypothetical protein ASF41_21670 [Methylobacterium sp. Leaf111]
MATTSHALVIEHVPFHADPILAAIDHHDEAWAVWQSAPDALVTRRHVEMEGALARLLATPCATQFGALALLRHLRWHIQHDAITDAAVLGRAADLALYLRLDFPATEPARAPVAPVLRLLSGLGEAVAALSLICGGLVVIGLATLA